MQLAQSDDNPSEEAESEGEKAGWEYMDPTAEELAVPQTPSPGTKTLVCCISKADYIHTVRSPKKAKKQAKKYGNHPAARGSPSKATRKRKRG